MLDITRARNLLSTVNLENAGFEEAAALQAALDACTGYENITEPLQTARRSVRLYSKCFYLRVMTRFHEQWSALIVANDREQILAKNDILAEIYVMEDILEYKNSEGSDDDEVEARADASVAAQERALERARISKEACRRESDALIAECRAQCDAHSALVSEISSALEE